LYDPQKLKFIPFSTACLWEIARRQGPAGFCGFCRWRYSPLSCAQIARSSSKDGGDVAVKKWIIHCRWFLDFKLFVRSSPIFNGAKPTVLRDADQGYSVGSNPLFETKYEGARFCRCFSQTEDKQSEGT
jgi:hypothetical protein